MVPKEALLRKLEPLLLPAIVALVGLAAFGLGRLSAGAAAGPRLIITMPEDAQAAAAAQTSPTTLQAAAGAGESQGEYVASKSGTKYYLSTCSGAARIKPENLVHFASAEEAQAAGYTPAANCPGL